MPPTAPRRLTLLDATLLVMGGIIGVGIFYKPGEVATLVPSGPGYFGMWALGAGLALCGAMTFAELAALFPRTGGWYVFLREGFGGAVAFLFAWIVLLVISTGACAGVAEFCAQQFLALAGGDAADRGAGATPSRLLAGGLVLGISGVAATGLKSGAIFQNLCMGAKLLAIGTFVFAGLALFGGGPVELTLPDGALAPGGAVPAAGDAPLWRGMVSATLPVLFTYGGWQLVTYIAPQVEDPVRNLPRAIVLGVLGVGAVYLLLNGAYVRVLGMDGVAASANAPRDLARATLGEHGATFLTAAMGVSALGFLVATLMTTPGIYVAMAEEGLFFRAVGRLHPGTGAPLLALAIQAGLTCVYLFAFPDVKDDLGDAVVFAEWIFHGLCGLALLRLVRRRGGERPFRSPLYPLFPLLYALLAAGVVIGNLVTSPWSTTRLGLGVLAVGAAVYLPWRAWTRRRAGGRRP